MKRFFKAIGKAGFYFILFFGMQLVVSLAFTIVIVTYMMLSGNADMSTFENDLIGHTTTIILISNSLSLFAVWLFFVVRKKRFTDEVQLHKYDGKLLLATVLFGLGFSNVISWGIGLIPFPQSLVDSFSSSYEAVTLGNPILNFLSVVVVTPIAEEVFFRGLVYTRLKRGMSTTIAAALSAVIFGIMHGEIIWMFYTFFVGLALVWIFEKTHSLLSCIVVHAINNCLAHGLENVTTISPVIEYGILLVSVVLLIVSTIYINKHCVGQDAEKIEDVQ